MNVTASATPPSPGKSPLFADILRGTAYRAVRRLGEGSMGLVVEAEHIALGHLVVVKLLHQALAQRADSVDRMRLEAQALARLRHPNLVAVTDFSVTPNGIPFLVMDRLAGDTVFDERARRGALPIAEAIDIARQTLAGLQAVHEAGIIHRDMKAANLFLCEGPPGKRVVKILDFGIAKVLATAPHGRAPEPLQYPTAEGVTVGTPRCLSPEQARGGAIDARTDVYAVGVLLYSLLVGAGPFDHIRGQMDLLHAHVSLAPVPPSHRAAQAIPREVEAAILRALAKRPEDRFASAADFALALEQALLPTTRLDLVRSNGTRPRVHVDVEPLPSSAGAAFEPTRWLPAVPALEVEDDSALTTQLSRVTLQPAALTTEPLGVGVAVLVVIASAGATALLAWLWLFP